MLMAKYVDGFVLVVPKAKVAEYKKMAKEGRDVWMKHGALEYYECMGADLKTKAMGGMPAPLRFTKLTKAKPGETVWFSFVVYKSKKHRDEVNKKVMDEMNEKYKDQKDMSMPFDMKRMAQGGFSVEVEG
jgi:uncharacterized protein YbaA (DUF1428 family)